MLLKGIGVDYLIELTHYLLLPFEGLLFAALLTIPMALGVWWVIAGVMTCTESTESTETSSLNWSLLIAGVLFLTFVFMGEYIWADQESRPVQRFLPQVIQRYPDIKTCLLEEAQHDVLTYGTVRQCKRQLSMKTLEQEAEQARERETAGKEQTRVTQQNSLLKGQ